MLYSLLFFFIYIVFTTLGFVVLFKNKNSTENRLFFATMIFFSLWAINNCILHLITDPVIAATIRKYAVFSWGVVYSVIFHFILVCSGVYKKITNRIKPVIIGVVIYLPAIVNILLYYFDSYGASEILLTNVGWMINAPIVRNFMWTNYFYAYYVISILLSIITLIIWRFKTKVLREIKQSNLLIIGFLFAFLFASLFEVILPLNGHIFTYGITLIIVILPLILIAYAIEKYGFMSYGSSQIGNELMSISNEGIIICDLNGFVKDINNGALTILKYASNNKVKSIDQLGLSKEILGDVESKKMTFKNSNGHRIDILANSKVLYDKLGEKFGCLVMFLDVYELVETQELLSQYSERLELKVKERTKELQETNNQLNIEIHNRKDSEKKVIHSANHDYLTGLFNRRYYETVLPKYDNEKYYPLTIVVADINGLKIINDAFGHSYGDDLLISAARTLKKKCVNKGFVARIGGDEFLMLLPNTALKETDKLINEIKLEVSKILIQSIPISISFGHSTKNVEQQSIQNVYRKAEDLMYREKLLEVPSMRSSAIETILKTLYEKDKKCEIHSRKVSRICELLAIKLGLSSQEVSMAKTAGLLHDIGKIIIPDTIIKKKGKLTSEEFEIIKNHSEIGFRILNSTPDMKEIALIVLNHHERWDGNGYPRGIAKDDIPYLSRIISIADSFDAMVSERTYKEKMSIEEAKTEVLKCAGSQFDPDIVPVLIEYIEEMKF